MANKAMANKLGYFWLAPLVDLICLIGWWMLKIALPYLYTVVGKVRVSEVWRLLGKLEKCVLVYYVGDSPRHVGKSEVLFGLA